MSRPFAISGALAWHLLCLAPTESALADPAVLSTAPGETALTDAQAHEKSRQFFDHGVHLFQHGHLAGALAEFEVAYDIHPNSAALQNIALCQKALFRYREAKASLQRLLARHKHELTPTDQKTAQAVIAELDDFIGTVRVNVVPPTARVTLDDTTLTASDLANPIELDVGEHRVRVEADGYETAQRSLTVAGSDTNAPINITLVPTHGFLNVLTPDPRSAIAVDGRAVAFESYRGIVLPGRHVIQVYRAGFEPFEEVVELEAGQSVTVRGKVGEPMAEEAPELTNVRSRPPGSPRQLRGWYGLLDVSVLSWNGAPASIDTASYSHLGYSYGLRAGYRLFTPVGVEAVIGITHHDVTGICQDASHCKDQLGDPIKYQLDTRRAGGALRLMSGGETTRFTSAIGMGAALQDLHIFTQPKGVDAYFSLEAGIQGNLDHFVIELVGFGWFESASNIKAGSYTPYQEGNGIQMFGLSLRAGWSEWTPRDAP